MKNPFYLLLKPIVFAMSNLSVDKRVSIITTVIQNLVSLEKNPTDSLKLLLKLDRNIYSLTGQEAVRYGNGLHTKHKNTRYHEFFVKNVCENDHVLDIGCGNGALSYDIVTNVKDVKLFGIDLNKRNINLAKRNYKHPNLKFIVGDAIRDLPDEKFDVLI